MTTRVPFSATGKHDQFVVLSATLSNRLDECFLVLPPTMAPGAGAGSTSEDEALAKLVNDLRRSDTALLGFWVIWKPDSQEASSTMVEYRHFLTADHVLNHAVLVATRSPSDDDIYRAFAKRIPKPGEENAPPMPPVIHVVEFRPVKSSEESR